MTDEGQAAAPRQENPPTRDRPTRDRPVRDAVRMEVVRLVTIRSTWALLIPAVGAGVVIALFVALLTSPGPLSDATSIAALTAGGDSVPMSPVGVLAAVLGVTTVAHDYRYGLLRAVLTAQPRRGAVMVARLTVLGVAAAAAAATVGVLGALLCWALERTPAHDVTTVRGTVLHLLMVVLWSWLGAGLAWLLRHAAGALAVLLLTPLLVEPGLAVIAQFEPFTVLEPVVRLLPFSAARQALGVQALPGGQGPGALLAAGVFLATTLAVLGLATTAVRRRDA